MITVETIATNRYAPQGSDAINLYATGAEGGSHLTLGQLVIAVAMRSAAQYEAQSILKMNRMTAGSDKLEKVAEYMEDIINEDADWNEIKDYCINVLDISEDDLPDDLSTYKKRMSAIEKLKDKADSLTQTSQTDMIDLQTMVNRRDVAYSTSSNIVRALGTSMSGNAENFTSY